MKICPRKPTGVGREPGGQPAQRGDLGDPLATGCRRKFTTEGRLGWGGRGSNGWSIGPFSTPYCPGVFFQVVAYPEQFPGCPNRLKPMSHRGNPSGEKNEPCTFDRKRARLAEGGIVGSTISEVAENARVRVPSVVRFCRGWIAFCKSWRLPRRVRFQPKEAFCGKDNLGDGSSHADGLKSLSGVEGRGVPGPQFAPAGRELRAPEVGNGCTDTISFAGAPFSMILGFFRLNGHSGGSTRRFSGDSLRNRCPGRKIRRERLGKVWPPPTQPDLQIRVYEKFRRLCG